MFLTAEMIIHKYGIDERIAKFYVDREPPKDNLYWKGKLLYLRPQPGYIFLPLITDIYYKSGVSLDQLLGEDFVQVLEKIGHYAAEEEFGLINKAELVHHCSELVKEKSKNDELLNNVSAYLLGQPDTILHKYLTPYPALHRGDAFLFALPVLLLSDKQQAQLIERWVALISTLLLMDDAEDLIDDQKKGDENAFIEASDGSEGLKGVKTLLTKNLDTLAEVNRTLAEALHMRFVAMAEKPFIQELLKS